MPYSIYFPSSENPWARAWIEGPDAQDFLHRVTSARAKGLTVGQTTGGCFLTAQAQIRSFFHLKYVESGRYSFELQAGKDRVKITELAQVIDELTFGEKLKLRMDETPCAWMLGPAGEPAPHPPAPLEASLQPIPFGDHQWFSVWGDERLLRTWAKDFTTLPESELERMRVLALIPSIIHEFKASNNPLELGLGYALASGKGCYPGQEVIEKTISLGSPARRLVLLRGTGRSVEIGSPLIAQGQQVGMLTSFSHDPDARSFWDSLAIVRKTHAQENLLLTIDASTSAQIRRISSYE